MSNKKVLDALKTKVANISAKLLSRKKYPRDTVTLVSDKLLNQFLAADSNHLGPSAMKSLKNSLTEYNDSHHRKSLQRFQCYNDFVELLLKSGAASCKFIDVALKTERRIIIRLDKQILRHVDYVLRIKAHLSELPLSPTSDRDNFSGKENSLKEVLLHKEIEYTCSYLASAVLFGLTTLPKFHIDLLKLRRQDIRHDPVSINLPYKSSDVFYRYFLPSPASAYLLRYLLFHDHLHRRTHKRKIIRPSDLVNKDSRIKRESVAKLFTSWTKSVLHNCGITVDKGLSPTQFYKAALAASLMSASPSADGSDSYPPFILSVQSRKIRSYSFGDEYMYHLSSSCRRSPVTGKRKQPSKKSTQPEITVLRQAVSEITDIRMPLEKDFHNLKKRNHAAARIINLANGYKDKLPLHDFENLLLLAKWISHMLNGSTKMTTINDYVSMIPRLLYNLSAHGVIHLLAPAALREIIQKTMRECTNASIRDHIIYFCKYLKKELGDKFQEPDWSRKDMLKEDIPSPKSFISFDDIQEARARCYSFFAAHIKKLVQPGLIKAATDKAIHKAKVYRQIIVLAFYAGLRISEIMQLRYNHILFDNGLILTIRKSKTRNGIRNLPLELLLPDDVLNEFKEFLSYVNERKKYYNSFVFENLDGKVYSTTTVRKDVQAIFESLGYLQFVFHHLRHSFANWFLLRCYAAFNMIPETTPFLSYELFKKKYLERIRVLLLGASSRDRGQEAFSFAMAALARLMGHGGPTVTLETYVHNTDWLFFLLSRSYETQTVRLTSKQAADFLQITYPSLPPAFKGMGKKTVNIDILLRSQRNVLAYR